VADVLVVETNVLSGNRPVSQELLRRIRKVQRLNVGEIIYLTDGIGRICSAKVLLHSLEILNCVEMPDDRLPIDVYLPVVKRDMDYAIYQLSQLGVRRIIPTFYQRSIVKSVSSNKLERWRRLSMAGLEIRRRAWMTEVSMPTSFPVSDFEGIAFVLHTGSGHNHNLHRFEAKEVSLFVGPEGGFTPDEIQVFDRWKAVFLQLKSGVLRAETSAVVGTAVVATVLGWLL